MAIDGIPVIDRLVDLAFRIPLAVTAPVEGVHDFVERQHVRVRHELRNARVVGELAVRVGRRRVGATIDAARPPKIAPSHRQPAATVTTVTTDPPFDDYDTMPATHIVQRLRRLDAAQLRATAQYEAAHRNRRTVLGKLEQLLGD